MIHNQKEAMNGIKELEYLNSLITHKIHKTKYIYIKGKYRRYDNNKIHVYK